jgi:hypothetical protein
MTKLVNLTGLVFIFGGKKSGSIMPSEDVHLRVKGSLGKPEGELNGIPLYGPPKWEVKGLPEQKEGVVYIVHSSLSKIIVGRSDIVIPGCQEHDSPIRGGHGTIVAFTRLVRIK